MKLTSFLIFEMWSLPWVFHPLPRFNFNIWPHISMLTSIIKFNHSFNILDYGHLEILPLFDFQNKKNGHDDHQKQP
eukprot:c21109_g1_i1 orf=825-1052(-)